MQNRPTPLILAAMLLLLLLYSPGVVLAQGLAGKADQAKYNKAVVAFCQKSLDKKVGSGECTHLASEALRIAGAEFVHVKVKDYPKPGDYVWGTFIKRLSWDGSAVVDSHPRVKCLPGDVIQYRDVAFSDIGNFPHHTALVAEVDDASSPTAVYEQNTGSPAKRVVAKNAINIRKMTSGWLRIYRPATPKRNSRQPLEFTLLNRTDEPLSFTMLGKKWTIQPYDSELGYWTWYCSANATLIVGRKSWTPKHRKAYEFFKQSNGKIGLREVK